MTEIPDFCVMNVCSGAFDDRLLNRPKQAPAVLALHLDADRVTKLHVVGRRFAVLYEANAKIYLGTAAPKIAAAVVTVTYGKYQEGWVSVARRGEKLDQQFANLKVGATTAQVTMNTVWGVQFFPLPAGSYKIMVPDVPHAGNMTRFYRAVADRLKHDQVWFPIQYGDNSRYVHVGNVSEGCVTVVDLNAWASICQELVSHRSPDGKYVGTLVVTGKPERAK